jgi:predicted transcriptional regulator
MSDEEEEAMTTKTVDARGRLTLGPRYANRLVIVREHEDGTVEVIPAEAVPAREVWLHKNPKALKAVRAGIEEAAAGRFAKAPDLKAGPDDGEDGA